MIANDLFQTPADGWYQISSIGEFPHTPTGLVQVVDEAGCRAMVDYFRQAAQQPNFAGVLIDFDHFSLDQSKPSEAAGWITQLEQRPTGLWAQIRWSDSGQQAVTGGRYRFISPVWKQDECEMLGNNRVRPLKLVNAAVTNDPNIRGMMPLSNRAAPPPVRVASRVFVVTNRTAVDFARGVVFAAAGLYIANRAPLTDEQRRAIFAKMHAVGSRSSGGAGSPNTPPGTQGDTGTPGDAGQTGTTNPDPIAALDTSNYDSAQNDTPNIRPLGDVPTPPPAINYAPVRDSAARIKAIEQQRDALLARKPVEPKKPDFSLVDTRKLASDLMRQGKGTNEIAAAVKAAEAQNAQHKAALEKIKHDIRRAFPNDGKKQRDALTKYMKQLDERFTKDHAAWQRTSDAIDKAVAGANKLIADEQTRADEAQKSAQQKQNNADVKAAQKLAEQKAKAIQKQVEADKAEARKKLAADEKAKRASEKSATSSDSLAAMSREMRRRNFYWQSLARGEVDIARTLYPNANTEEDLKTVEDLARGVKSKNDQKAHAKALAELAKQAPAKNYVEQIP